MQSSSQNPFYYNHMRRACVVLCLGMGMVGQWSLWSQDGAGLEDRVPQIVSDDPLPPSTPAADLPGGPQTSPPVPAALPPNPAPAAPAAPAPVGDDETVRKAAVETPVLVDPMAKGLTGDGAWLATPLLPAPGGLSLSTPETSAAITEVKTSKPITASTPFRKEKPASSGPVVMGTDLEPNAAVTPMSPEQTPPEFADAPVLTGTDPWLFSVELASLYDDNVHLSNRDQQSDFVFMLTASVAWQNGDVKKKRGSWARVFYEATGLAFAKDSQENNVDHDFQAGGQKRWGSLALALEGRYRRLSGATPDLGDRVQRDEYGVKASGEYDVGGRTFLEANAGYHAVRYQESALADYDEWLAEGFAGYEWTGRTRLAVGGAVGRMDVQGSGKQDFQRALVKVRRASSGALGLNAKAGAEFRQTGSGNDVTPVFAVGADWEPVADSTRVSVQAFRETVASGALAGENYLRTGAALRLAQQIGTRFSAGLETGYEQLQYSGTSSGVSSGRADDYFFARPSLKYEFAGSRHAEVFYSFREDDSSVEDFSFNANQWGLAFGLEF